MDGIKIVELTEFTPAYLKGINKLLQQLTANKPLLGADELKGIIASENSHLFILIHEGDIAGMTTVGHYRTPTGMKYWIEDVAVDNSFRGKGLGKTLIQHAIGFVSQSKKATLMLTSTPKRVAANNLYQSIGFQRKETNVYKMSFDKG